MQSCGIFAMDDEQFRCKVPRNDRAQTVAAPAPPNNGERVYTEAQKKILAGIKSVYFFSEKFPLIIDAIENHGIHPDDNSVWDYLSRGLGAWEDMDFALYLIQKGANVNRKSKYVYTPLSRCYSLPIAKLLLQKGANSESALD